MQISTLQDVRFKSIQQRYGDDSSYASLARATCENGIANDVLATDVLALAGLAKIARDNIRFLIQALRGCQDSKTRYADHADTVVSFYNHELEALIRHNLVYAWRHYRIIQRDYVAHHQNALRRGG